MIPRFYIIKWFALLSGCFASAGCEASREDRQATHEHFKRNKLEYLAVVADIRSHKKPSGPLAGAVYNYSQEPLIAEFSPVNFYYSVVFAGDYNILKESAAMLDEGVLMKDLGEGFYLVQRGYN